MFHLEVKDHQIGFLKLILLNRKVEGKRIEKHVLCKQGKREAGVLIAVKIKFKAKSITKIKEGISQKVQFWSKILILPFYTPT